MSDSFPLVSFSSFAANLQQARLPGTLDRRFLRDVYRLAARCSYLGDQGQQEARRASRQELRPVIRKSRTVLTALERLRKHLADTERLAEEIAPDPPYWKTLFHPADEALSDLVDAIEQILQRTIDQLHPRFRKKKEHAEWDLLIKPYDYPLARLGWKPVETWFLEELDRLVSEYCKGKKMELRPGDRYRLIQAIFRAAFNENKEFKTIQVAIRRARRRRSCSPAQ